MIYHLASNLLRDSFNRDDLVPLFRELPNRETSPEIWDRQVKYWSTFMKKWGYQNNVLDFSVNELTHALEYHNVLPPLQPSVDILVTSTILISQDSLLKREKSFLSSITDKLFGFMGKEKSKCDIYIFVDNLKNVVQKIMCDVECETTFSTDVVLTNEEIKEKYCQNYDFELIKAELQHTKGVKAYPNGYHIQCGRYSTISQDLVVAILNTKSIQYGIQKRLKQIEHDTQHELQKACQFKKQNRIKEAKNCLRRKKILQAQESRMSIINDNLSNILSQLAENELTKLITKDITQINNAAKKMQQPNIEDVDQVMIELGELIEDSQNLSDALQLPSQKYDDEEIEAELQALFNDDQPTKSNQAQASQPSQYPKMMFCNA